MTAIEMSEVSDGKHTFKKLYEHRGTLNFLAHGFIPT